MLNNPNLVKIVNLLSGLQILGKDAAVLYNVFMLLNDVALELQKNKIEEKKEDGEL